MICADPVAVGADSVWIYVHQEGEMKDHISVTGQDGTFAAYISRPKTLPAPAVVVDFGGGGLGAMEVCSSTEMGTPGVRILRFKNLPTFRHYRGLQNHV